MFFNFVYMSHRTAQSCALCEHTSKMSRRNATPGAMVCDDNGGHSGEGQQAPRLWCVAWNGCRRLSFGQCGAARHSSFLAWGTRWKAWQPHARARLPAKTGSKIVRRGSLAVGLWMGGTSGGVCCPLWDRKSAAATELTTGQCCV